jgi:Bacterial Ig domain
MKTLKSFSFTLGKVMTAILLAAAPAIQASTIWNGPTNGFFHPVSGAGDLIVSNVYIQRGGGGGLYNAATNPATGQPYETSAVSGTSPEGTLWSLGSLSNYSTLTYSACPLEATHRPPNDIGKTYVVHLLTNDIYLQLTLTNWGGAGGSGLTTFGYTLSSPTVPPSITNPSAGATFSAPANVAFQATVLTDVPVQFTNVQFYTNNVLAGSVTTAPFNFTANNLGAGSYSLTAVEIAAGNFTTSSVVNFTVTAPITVGIGITNPAAGEVFSAPANVTIQTAITNGTSVTNVQFYAGTSSLGSATNSPFNFTNSFGAGSYSLTAVATAGGINTTSGAVGISVVTPTPLSLSNSAAVSSTNFEFSYPANVGLSYVVQLSTNLTGTWISLVTNVAASNPVVFEDPNATNRAGYYRVGLLPNP